VSFRVEFVSASGGGAIPCVLRGFPRSFISKSCYSEKLATDSVSACNLRELGRDPNVSVSVSQKFSAAT
jgi:hypothetical protein